MITFNFKPNHEIQPYITSNHDLVMRDFLIKRHIQSGILILKIIKELLIV